jgi:hypothetical protein
MCLYPKIIRNRKYVVNKKNGGDVPPCFDERVKWVSAGCGKCIECRKSKSREWHIRLAEELKTEKLPAWFVTLTYSEESLQNIDNKINSEHKKIKEKLKKQGKLKGSSRNNKDFLKGYNRDNEIARYSVRKFTERWRKKFGKTIKHWLVTELGGQSTERLHIHGIVWCRHKEDIAERWQYGIVDVGKYVNSETVSYITKYLSKSDEKHKTYIPRMFVSHGIGKGYLQREDSKLNKYKKNGETNEAYRTLKGFKLSLPIYYRNKIYTEDEREKLWIEKLDKNERWVLGQKIDISENDRDYYETLKEARIKNKMLGYSDDSKNWELKKYEQDKRNLKRLERIKKLYG